MKPGLSAVAITALLTCQLGTAAASPRDDVLEGLQKCAGVSDNTARLACYDALVRPAQTAMARPPEPQEADHPPTPEEQKSWFGFDLSGLFGTTPKQQSTPDKFGSDQLPATHEAEAKAETEVDSISANVTEYAFTPFGKFIVFLDNGQVWKQNPGDADLAHFLKNPKDNKVTISRGFIGSYNLSINDSSKTFKVDRVK